MDRFDYVNGAFDIVWEEIPNNTKKYIESKLGYKESFYSQIISFAEYYINEMNNRESKLGYKHHWYYLNEWNYKNNDNKNNWIECFYTTVKTEQEISLKRDLCQKFIEYLENNRKNVEEVIYEYD